MDEAHCERFGGPALNRKHLVVCIDDDPAVLSALVRLLAREPYEFIAVGDPEEGLDLVRKRDVSLVIADQRMPVMSGTSVLQLVKAASPATVRLLLTGSPRATWVIQAQERELMDLVLGKPWDDDELKHTVLTQLSKRELSGPP